MQIESKAFSLMVKSQEDVVRRYSATKNYLPGVRSFERNEYTRIMSYGTAKRLGVSGEIVSITDWAKEGVAGIDLSAKRLMKSWHDRIATHSGNYCARFVERYVAFKWMLGHPDSDTFPGALGLSHSGAMTSESFRYIRTQIKNGEWDTSTANAMRHKTVCARTTLRDSENLMRNEVVR